MYDGLGQRVSKTVSGQTTTYVYDAFGNLAAEYGGESTGCGTCYVTTDHLGSTRLLTNSAGGPFSRYDYEPFGQEIGAGYDGRTAPMGFTAMLDAANPKFTGQIRDQETTLDWFNVRYYSGAQGRFQSPDPANAGADPSNPQSWNGYAYVGNNPLSYTDPSGMFIEAVGPGTAAGGPAGAIIGAAIDIGEILAGLFGSGLFGGPPPSIAPSLATPSSPILQPSPDFDSQGWNEQPPGSDSGSSDPGTLFGSGNTSPFVFSWEDAAQSGATSGSGSGFYGPLLWDRSGQRRAWFNGMASLFGYDQNVPRPSCFGGFLSNTLGNLNPVSPSLASLGEGVGAFYGALKLNQALKYALTTPSRTFGTSHLIYANKSSVFRGLLKEAGTTAKASIWGSIVLAEGQAFWDEIQTMRGGGCQ